LSRRRDNLGAEKPARRGAERVGEILPITLGAVQALKVLGTAFSAGRWQQASSAECAELSGGASLDDLIGECED
jgi:hypothetical protein